MDIYNGENTKFIEKEFIPEFIKEMEFL